MTIKCVQCGTELADSMKICFNCGKPQQIMAGTSAPQWEYCEIEYELVGLLGMSHRFLAKAVGPKGTYRAAESNVKISTNFPHPAVRKDNQACDDLIRRLVADGWEPVSERGPEWFSHRFRRRVL
jgi:hypothetical protein